ncbi:MAG: metallophosphoesterase [Candidatus Micrarchaeaceae archaeon]
MRLGKGFEIVDGLPILYVKRLDAIVCSDLHLGYEGVMAGKGVFLPKVNLRRIKRMLKQAVEMTGAGRIIIDGDIKNEFSKVHLEEFNELREMVDFLREELDVGRITLVKGNHDNFVDRIKGGLGIEIFGSEALLDGILFFHGEGLPEAKGYKTMIMGHVHPAIAIYNGLGVKEKFHCFLYGKARKGPADAIVLPAMNYFAEGVAVNLEDVKGMAPVFRSIIDIKKMRAVCIGEGEALDFGTVEQLSKLK